MAARFGVGGDAFLQAFGLADVQHVAFGIHHAIDAGRIGQRLQIRRNARNADEGEFRDVRSSAFSLYNNRCHPGRVFAPVAGGEGRGARWMDHSQRIHLVSLPLALLMQGSAGNDTSGYGLVRSISTPADSAPGRACSFSTRTRAVFTRGSSKQSAAMRSAMVSARLIWPLATSPRIFLVMAP